MHRNTVGLFRGGWGDDTIRNEQGTSLNLTLQCERDVFILDGRLLVAVGLPP